MQHFKSRGLECLTKILNIHRPKLIGKHAAESYHTDARGIGKGEVKKEGGRQEEMEALGWKDLILTILITVQIVNPNIRKLYVEQCYYIFIVTHRVRIQPKENIVQILH